MSLIDKLTEKGVQFESQKEKIDTTTPTGQFMLTVFVAVVALKPDTFYSRVKEYEESLINKA